MARFFLKLIFHLSKFPLRLIEFFDPRLYMRIYHRLLSGLGVGFLGVPRYISSLAVFDDFNRVSFGDGVVVSKNVVFLTHDYSVTAGLKAINEPPATDVAFIRSIVVGDNVFLGMGVFLTPGVEVGSNVVVGAGSVLRGKIPSNSIVVGNPGVVVGKLDEAAVRWKERIALSEIRVDRK